MKTILSLLLFFCLCSCPSSKDKRAVQAKEMVMGEGDQIVASTAEGIIKIVASIGLKRSYTWEGATRSLVLWARKKKWHGRLAVLGAYYPGPGNHWKIHKGITRAVVEEGHIRFDKKQDFYDWLEDEDWSYLRSVYTNDGLLIGWSKNIPRQQLNVVVFQVLIAGERPDRLDGADDRGISRSNKMVNPDLGPAGKAP